MNHIQSYDMICIIEDFVQCNNTYQLAIHGTLNIFIQLYHHHKKQCYIQIVKHIPTPHNNNAMILPTVVVIAGGLGRGQAAMAHEDEALGVEPMDLLSKAESKEHTCINKSAS